MEVKVDKLESNQSKSLDGNFNSDQIRDRCERATRLLTPKILEAGRRQLCVPDRVLDIAMSEIRLQRPSIVSLVRQCIAASVSQHVGMSLEA